MLGRREMHHEHEAERFFPFLYEVHAGDLIGPIEQAVKQRFEPLRRAKRLGVCSIAGVISTFQNCFGAALIRSGSIAYFAVNSTGTSVSNGGFGPEFSFGQMRWL